MKAKGTCIGLVFVLALASASAGCHTVTKDDASIAAGVRHKLTESTELAGYPIVVASTSGNVVLEGRVDRSEQREDAEMLAKRVDGVESVSNQIYVASVRTDLRSGEDSPNSVGDER
jgi:hypothetical protein